MRLRWKVGLVAIALVMVLVPIADASVAQEQEDEMLDPLTAALAGGVIGYAIRRDGRVQAVSVAQGIEQAKVEKPANYEIKSLDARTARDNEKITVAATRLQVLNYPSNTKFYIRINEPNNPQFDLSQTKVFEGFIYQIFISNQAGTGQIDLIASRGLAVETTNETLAELAARLGSINTFDRRGEVIWMDDFEDNINKWNTASAVGAGSSIALSTEAARNGAKSCKLVTGSTLINFVLITRGMAIPSASKVGFEYSFVGLNADTKLYLTSSYTDGSYSRYGIVRYIVDTQQLQIYDGSANAYVTLDTVRMWLAAVGLWYWYTWKLVIDMVNNKYVRLIVGGSEYDISNYDLESSVSTVTKALTVEAKLERETASNLYIYIDDAIVTRNEP